MTRNASLRLKSCRYCSVQFPARQINPHQRSCSERPVPYGATQSTEDYLRSRSSIHSDDGCWEWIKSRNQWGYGVTSREGKLGLSHRLAYQTFVGEIPEDMEVCHTCDNPPCLNPAHLFLGTHKDNVQDMMTKGRGRKAVGIANAAGKLSEEEVQDITHRHMAGESLATLATAFGVSSQVVHGVVTGKSWKHIQREVRTVHHGHGVHHHQAKLCEQDVRDIREQSAKGVPTSALMQTYGMGRTPIRNVIKRKAWKHIA